MPAWSEYRFWHQQTVISQKSVVGQYCACIVVGSLAAFVPGMLSRAPVQAAETFGNTGIQFDVETVVEFEFLESHGAYQSTFGVVNLDSGEKTPLLAEVKPSDSDDPIVNKRTDYLGTPGNAIPKPKAEFDFKAHQRYAFYLESTYQGRAAGLLFSTDALNPSGRQQVKFEGGLSELTNGGTVLRWDDTGSLLVAPSQDDRDFNDFTVRAGGHQACPYQQCVHKQ